MNLVVQKLSELKQQLQDEDNLMELWSRDLVPGANNGFWVVFHEERFQARCFVITNFPSETARDIIIRYAHSFDSLDAIPLFDLLIKRGYDERTACQFIVNEYGFWDVGCIQ